MTAHAHCLTNGQAALTFCLFSFQAIFPCHHFERLPTPMWLCLFEMQTLFHEVYVPPGSGAGGKLGGFSPANSAEKSAIGLPVKCSNAAAPI